MMFYPLLEHAHRWRRLIHKGGQATSQIPFKLVL